MNRFKIYRIIFVILCIGVSVFLGYRSNILNGYTVNASMEYQLVINEVMTNNRNSIRDDDGDFEDWIEIYNNGDTPVNLAGFGLSKDSKEPFYWTFPDITIEPKSFNIIWASGKNKKDSKDEDEIHANFTLNNKDRYIILTSPDKRWKDIFILEPMGEDISFGRFPDGSSDFYGFDDGTPGEPNEGQTLVKGPNTERLESPIFSHNGGFYTEGFELSLKTVDNDAKIYYTLDGSIPTEKSKLYTEPISIFPNDGKATVIRARAYKEGYPKSDAVTHSYFVSKNIYESFNIPVISIVTDPDNLFDYRDGIYIPGRVFDRWREDNPDSVVTGAAPANYNQRGKLWEREASVELFETDGRRNLAQNIGIRIHGGYSRSNSLKSLALYARENYDENPYFYYDFFGNREIIKYSKILLRTSATDSKHSFFRDAFMQSLAREVGILDTQRFKPCIVFINGDYYGIHNMREAYDKDYINSHYGINPEDVVMIKNPTGVAGVEIHEGFPGDEMHYNKIIAFLKHQSVKNDQDYSYVKTQMDIDNFIEYNIFQIYYDNRDWPGNNVLVWRKRTEKYEPDAPYGHDGRWRWALVDLDYGFGLYQGEKAIENNSLERALEKNGPDWPNPPWSTFLLRSLLENNEFKNQFINTFADRINTIFKPELVIEKIEIMKSIYYPNVEKHILRWNLHSRRVENWLEEIEKMKRFAAERPRYVIQHIIECFGLKGTANIKINADEGGIVKINSLTLKYSDVPWEGLYFKGIPITIEAIPEPGYVFAGWEGINESDPNATIELSYDISVKALFRKETNR